ncbi:hypothetical protein VTK26DRAFT_4117 [Humicola hyalothermophila]
MSELLPVLLANVPFNLAQTRAAATVCAVLSCVLLGVMLAVLGWSLWVRYPPMPVDPRCVAGALWYYLRCAPDRGGLLSAAVVKPTRLQLLRLGLKMQHGGKDIPEDRP